MPGPVTDDSFTRLQQHESNARTYARTFDRTLCRASGSTVWDADGRDHLDLLACAGALPLGHNHPYVMERVQDFLRSGHILQGLDMPTPAKHAFVDRLLATLPAGFAADARLQFCGPSGSDAVEAALKLFKTATGRRSVLAFHGAYHGMTLGALSLMGNLGPKAPVPGLAAETHFLPFPNSARCPFGVGGVEAERISLNYIDTVLSDPESGITKPAMVIVEAVQGEGGCIPASAEWLRGLRDITERHDVPLVLDEVQTGLGRTGTMFAHEVADIVPDAIVMSKALGGGFPLAVLAYRSRYDVWRPGAHAGTFRGNQIALVAGAATLEYIQVHRLHAEAARKGAVLMGHLRQLARDFPCIGDVRGRGLMVGAEIVQRTATAPGTSAPLDGGLAAAIKRACFDHGLMVETGGRHGAVLRFLPPLVITDAEIEQAMLRLQDALTSVLGAP